MVSPYDRPLRHPVSPATGLFVEKFVRDNNFENIPVLHCWIFKLWQYWLPVDFLHKWQVMRKMFTDATIQTMIMKIRYHKISLLMVSHSNSTGDSKVYITLCISFWVYDNKLKNNTNFVHQVATCVNMQQRIPDTTKESSRDSELSSHVSSQLGAIVDALQQLKPSPNNSQPSHAAADAWPPKWNYNWDK